MSAANQSDNLSEVSNEDLKNMIDDDEESISLSKSKKKTYSDDSSDDEDGFVPPPPGADESDDEDEFIPPPPGADESDDEFIPPPTGADESADESIQLSEVDDSEEDDDVSVHGESDEENEDGYVEQDKKNKKKTNDNTKEKMTKPLQTNKITYDMEDENADESDEEKEYNKLETCNYQESLLAYHATSVSHNNEEVSTMVKVIRDNKNNIIDDLHKTMPILTKYERTRVLGQRAKQLENGHAPFIRVADNVIDCYVIAVQELEQKKIPFIIRRPLPSGGSEYWHLKDLEIIA